MENQISEEINILLDTNYLYKDIASIKGENVVFICSFLNIFDFLASDRINIDGPINESKIERWRNAIEVGIINSELISLSHWHYLAKGQYGNIHITSNLVQMEDKAYLLTEKIINRKFSIKEDRDDLVFLVDRFKSAKHNFASETEKLIRSGFEFMKNNQYLLFENGNKIVGINEYGWQCILAMVKNCLIENLNTFSITDCNSKYKFDVKSFKWNLVEVWLYVFSKYLEQKIIKRNYQVSPNDYVDYFNLLYLGEGMLYATNECSIIENFNNSGLESRLTNL